MTTPTTAFSKMIVLFYCLLIVCNGQPIVEIPEENATVGVTTTIPTMTVSTTMTTTTLGTTTTTSTINVEQFDELNNEEVRKDQSKNGIILRGLSTFVQFLDVPKHTETQLGSSVLLPCRTTNPVMECQWSWQPLLPVHLPLPDISESPNESRTTTTTTSSVTTTSAPTAHPLPVRRFSAFGNGNNDCSVRFSSMKHEQTGYWTCAARNSTREPFTGTAPAKLTIVNDQGSLIDFAKHEEAIEIVAGSSAQIMCRTLLPVRECQWSWRRLNESEPWNLEVKKFPAFGNDSTDCSIKFKNVLAEQEGYWSCAARINPNSSFVRSNPVRFLISEVEFVQLSRGVQVAAGESVLLRCMVNKPVVRCEWSWRATNSSKEPLLVKKFAPNKDADHDCSVRFKNILYEEEGLWTCGIRLSPDGMLHEAPPATVSLLPSAKVNLVEMPSDTTIPVGTDVTLKCVTSSRVEKCSWSWKSLHGNDPEIVIREFPSNGDLGRDCSLDLQHVRPDQQGLWSCQVSIPSLNTMLSSSFVKLITFEQDEVKFSELSQDIQISSGGTILLRCVTSSPVEQCRWSLTPVNSNTTVVVKQFPAAGSESRDCSVRLSHALAEQEGLWTCGARIHGHENYTDAPPAKLSLLEPEPVVVTIWTAPHQMVSLACTLGRVTAAAQCHWIHAPNLHIRQNVANTTKKARHNLQMNYSTGICTIEFKPDYSDLGQWTCRFTKRDKDTEIELGSATLVLLNTAADEKLGWIVGALTAIVLFLMIIVVVLVVCKTRLFVRRSPQILETMPASKRDRGNVRCVADKRVEHDNCSNVADANNILPNRSPHLYERVEKYSGVMPKRLYENFGL